MSNLVWITAQGQRLTPDQMTPNHAKNAFNVLVRRHGDTVARLSEMGDALHRRAFGKPAMTDAQVNALFKTTMRRELKSLFGREDYWRD